MKKNILIMSFIIISSVLSAQKPIEIKLWPNGAPNDNNLKEQKENGPLYVAEPTTGLTKFGTGICGTVFASNERSSSSCINCDAHSLCVCDNHLLLGYQGQARGVIDVFSIEWINSWFLSSIQSCSQ